VASTHHVPVVVVPAGTRNHFALDLGLDRDDVVGALAAFRDGVDRVVDLAEVNGRVFVNNASLGVYATIVQSEDYRDAKLKTAAALLPEIVGPQARDLDLRLTLPSGEDASPGELLLVSNNAYELHHVRGGGTRQRLDAGELGIVSVQVRNAADANALAALEAVGQVQRFSGWREWTAAGLEVRSGAPVDVGVDGEALSMQPPLEFRSLPGALVVRLPRSAVGMSPAAQIVRVSSGETIQQLVRVALGRDVP
jgi:diacylglycerol kinase family enzyme